MLLPVVVAAAVFGPYEVFRGLYFLQMKTGLVFPKPIEPTMTRVVRASCLRNVCLAGDT